MSSNSLEHNRLDPRGFSLTIDRKIAQHPARSRHDLQLWPLDSLLAPITMYVLDHCPFNLAHGMSTSALPSPTLSNVIAPVIPLSPSPLRLSSAPALCIHGPR